MKQFQTGRPILMEFRVTTENRRTFLGHAVRSVGAFINQSLQPLSTASVLNACAPCHSSPACCDNSTQRHSRSMPYVANAASGAYSPLSLSLSLSLANAMG